LPRTLGGDAFVLAVDRDDFGEIIDIL